MRYAAENGDIQVALTGESLVTRPMSCYREPAFLKLVELLRHADVALTNVEMLFHDYEDAPSVMPGGTYMRASPQIIDELQWMGINLAAVANNHALDYGENGLVRHLNHLRRSGLAHAGIGHSMGEAREAAYLETAAGRVALIALTSSGPPTLYAGHQGPLTKGRPGANFLRYTTRYTVDQELFLALRRFRDEFRLNERQRDPLGRAANHSWGLSDTEDSESQFYLGDLHDSWQYPVPNGYCIRLGEPIGRELVPDAADLQGNLSSINEARRNADWVIVSVHSHESGPSLDAPPSLLTDFAHAAIDAGADIVHGHGPHRDRGIEVYKGRPIFYSIGHFILENDTVSRVPPENLARVGLDPWSSTPADFAEARSGRERQDEWLGSAGRPAMWRDIVGLVDFSSHRLARVILQPIDLGFKRPRSQRGRPVIATGDEAKEVLRDFEALCEPFGTRLKIEGETAEVVLDEG